MEEVDQTDNVQMEGPSSYSVEEPKDDHTDEKVGTITLFVEKLFKKSSDARLPDEERWLKAYRNYRGIYGPDTKFTESEKSRVFIKTTKTKVIASSGQLQEVIFGADRFPIGIDPTTLPEGISEAVHFDTQDTPTEISSEDEKLLPGETSQDLSERLGALKEKLKPVSAKLEEGSGTTQTDVTFHPAQVTAKKMEKKIHDQLEESQASKQLRYVLHELPLFGSGVMKGPFAVDKEYPRWDDTGVYSPVVKTVPMTSQVSVWNAYPDPDAYSMEECEFFIERHRMSRSGIKALKNRPLFRHKSIENSLKLGPNYVEKWWESALQDDNQSEGSSRYEVLEFWGLLDSELLEEENIDIPSDLKGKDRISVNVWICNGQVLRLVLNPYAPTYLPYHVAPYEVNPYSIFGIGVAENMEDTQVLMNGFMRMAIDNAALSGSLLIEIDENNLVPGQDLTIYPGKVFRREAGAPGQAIFGTKFPNVSNENMQMFDKARQLADESTGIPSFSHGQTGVSGTGRTASGISMLMSAANGSTRTVIKNIDDYLLAPLGKALYHFNMQFDYDPELKGDLEVKARGTESLMANEVRSQRLLQFLSVVQNPVLAPFAKMDYIIREIAKSMELDPDKVVNNLGDAAIQAEILKKFQSEVSGDPTAEGGPPSPSDSSGGGGSNIGTGTAPTPSEDGFSGNVQ